jgi:LysW-gamma-L-lysine carboxypeptidase
MDHARAVALIHGLVAIPSLSRDEARASAWLVDQMHALGLDRAFVDEAGNAVGEIGADDAARTVVLLGHIDTVPGDIPVRIEHLAPPHPAPSHGPRTAPPAPRTVLFGRGSVDAKGPLATFVAAAARLGSDWAREHGMRLVVVGAVEEEAATSKGARFIAARFDGVRARVPDACVIGEPSHWHRVTLGYKGRLLLDLVARQPMAHTAGPDAGIAEAVVRLWNWISGHAARINTDRDKVFDQLSPSLRRFITSTHDMHDQVDAQIAWRLPLGFDALAFARQLLTAAAEQVGASPAIPDVTLALGDAGRDVITIRGGRTMVEFRFRGWEHPWRGDRANRLVRGFVAGLRGVDPATPLGFLVKTGTSDMNVVAPIWQCPIVAYGPGDSALDHTPDEHLDLDEYWRAIQVLEGALRSFAAA